MSNYNKSTCNGCLMDQANQLAHMEEGGCLNIKRTDLLLYKLDDYMLTPTNIYKYSQESSHENNEIISKEHKKVKTEKKEQIDKKNKTTEKKELQPFSPSEKDKLFWCFYIFLYGFEEYEISKNSSFVTEKNFKIKTVEKISTIKDKLKEMKLKLNEIQDELVNQQIISIKGLQALCMMYEINIMIVKERTLYEIIVNEKPVNVIVIKDNKTIIQDDLNEEKLTHYRNNYWKIDNIAKPLNAFSSYSLGELQDICKKLEIPIVNDGKKIQKKDLYQCILSKL